MSKDVKSAVLETCTAVGNDKARMMDIVRGIQSTFGCVSDEAIDLISEQIKVPRVEVESTVSFYAFLSREPKGRIVIRLCNDIIDKMNGYERVAKAFQEELGIAIGETTADGKITLEHTPCIGMCDQAPAVLINNEVVTNLSTDMVRELVKVLKETGDEKKLVRRFGDGNNAHRLVKSMVQNNIRRKGEVIFADYPANEGLKKALAMSPVEVLNEVKTARLRGRGGAGFPAGIKWEFTRKAEGKEKYVLCNADEGEPGTFKDRVLLTELPDRIFEGMTVAGYAIGAQHGILYLRGEYAYLYEFLQNIIEERRKAGFLGKNVLGREGFNFDIRLQLGAGAYICGEETSLISSCEGFRGDPKNRPPFPAQRGYMGFPTTVNNVETFVAVTRVLDMGAGWFSELGSKGSTGTKLLSISGDCRLPGVYEVPFGIPMRELLKEVGAEDAAAVQVGGPSGQMISPADFDRTICYDDLATGGSIMIFNSTRNILDVVHAFMEFFVEESCGYCTPCRSGNVLLLNYLEKVMKGKAEPADLELMKSLGHSVKTASRCGLGQTSPNPILSTLEKFPGVYEGLVHESEDGLHASFDIRAVLREAEAVGGRKSVDFS